ncbi:hypothetical protein HD553DRAFT_27308 [Filobasidium floriforme]|uniref:uncharacterized protein n=1 Tax=Filobasidium floriforme TaxID=5210 RepID=UPI001E8DA9D5|nr:uncharacterized protein HD553DRAFT_27308 [Filobasidium floriforme]KAH8085367.1 hypothetical protein HD553DRAFT_27308 [Filobasidium floriforme]
MEDANMEDAPLQIESGPHDIDMEAAVQSDPFELLMKALPDDLDPETLKKPLARSTAECEPLIGGFHVLAELSYTKALLAAAHFKIDQYRGKYTTLPDGCGIWEPLMDVAGFNNWAPLRKVIKIRESPGSTIAFWLSELKKDPYVPNQPIEVAKNQQSRIEHDFAQTFLGQGVVYLHGHIVALGKTFRYETHYAPIVPIIQSSGSGKSKTALELARLELGFFTCVREEPKDDHPVSEPKRDDTVALWLTPFNGANKSPKLDQASTKTDLAYKQADRVAIWLMCFADEFAKYLTGKWFKMFHQDITTPVDISQPEMADRWKEFKSAVAKDMSPLSMGERGSVSARRQTLLESINANCEKALEEAVRPKVEQASATTSYRHHSMLRDLVLKAGTSWKALESILPVNSTDFIHLTIDECGQMGSDQLTSLRSHFNSMKLSRSWVLLLDTNTQISRLAGSEALSSSARPMRGALKLCEPFSFLPQDLGMIAKRKAYMDICEGRDRSKLDSDMKEYLPLMGRPLWADSWLQRSETGGLVYAGVDLTRVFLKLTKVAKKGATPVEDSEQIIALFTQRFPLAIPGFHGVVSHRKFAESLVENHLRRLEKVLPREGAIITNTPSEPILSLAATHETRQHPRHYWRNAIKAIHHGVDQFQIDVGMSGEEFALMMLSAAADGAATKWQNQHDTVDTLKPIRLSIWLKALFHRLNDEQLAPGFKELLVWADDYFVNFTQFVTMSRVATDGDHLPHCDMVQAWVRRAAIRGAPRQAGWDLAVPIYYQFDPNAPFDARRIIYLVIQVKNTVNPSSSKWQCDFATGLKSFSGEALMAHRRLFIWLDLNPGGNESLDIRPDPRMPGTSMQTRSPVTSEPDFHLYVAGHSENVYEPLRFLEEAFETPGEMSLAAARMGALIGSMRAYGSGPFDKSGLDEELLKQDQAFFRGSFPASAA